MEFKKIVSRTNKFSGVIDYNFNIKILIKVLIIVSDKVSCGGRTILNTSYIIRENVIF